MTKTASKKTILSNKASSTKTTAKKITTTKTQRGSRKSVTKRNPISATQNPETTNRFIVHKGIRLMATPAEVWDALTNPEKTKKYFFNCKVFSDWKVGSPITWKGTVILIKKIELHGTIVKIEPGKLLVYTLKNEHSSSISTVTEKLIASEGDTVLTISDDVGEGEGAEDRYRKSEKGWTKVLNGLKKLVEKNR